MLPRLDSLRVVKFSWFDFDTYGWNARVKKEKRDGKKIPYKLWRRHSVHMHDGMFIYLYVRHITNLCCASTFWRDDVRPHCIDKKKHVSQTPIPTRNRSIKGESKNQTRRTFDWKLVITFSYGLEIQFPQNQKNGLTSNMLGFAACFTQWGNIVGLGVPPRTFFHTCYLRFD
jgi:hypothetical protein